MPVTEIVYGSIACFERFIDLIHLPVMVRNKTMSAMESMRTGTTYVDNDPIIT